jgi:hypothetical protein
MAKFVKEILSEGEYHVSTMAGPKKRKFTKEELVQLATTGSEMIQAGIKIPAPFKHVVDGKFVAPIEESSSSPDPKDNAGFWEKFYTATNDHGTVSIYGVIEAPGSEDDPNSPAYKISRTVKDTSIGILPGFTDGKGRNWGANALVHVALPVDPVEPGQSNFLPLPDNVELVAMSRKVFSNLSQLLTLFADKGISLPADTNEDNILERLLIAFMNNNGNASSPLTKKPSSGKVETYPIMMNLSQPQVDAILAAKVVDPSTGKPFEADTFKDVQNSEVEALKGAAQAMSLQLNKVYEERYQERIAALVATGRVTKEYADAHLIPLSQSVQMSFKDGKPESNALDVTLIALESLPATMTGSQVDTAQFMGRVPVGSKQELNPMVGSEMSQERIDAIANSLLKSSAY